MHEEQERAFEYDPDQDLPATPEVQAGEAEASARERPRTVRDLTPRELGMKGEEMAAAYLERKGWYILDRNWRCEFGEVDIVAREDDEDDTIVLVEVKTRLALGERGEGMPELAVDSRKRRRYKMLALAYIVNHPEADAVRFDVIALNVVGEGAARLRHLSGAYEVDD